MSQYTTSSDPFVSKAERDFGRNTVIGIVGLIVGLSAWAFFGGKHN